jgi:hypothetical protein
MNYCKKENLEVDFIPSPNAAPAKMSGWSAMRDYRKTLGLGGGVLSPQYNPLKWSPQRGSRSWAAVSGTSFEKRWRKIRWEEERVWAYDRTEVARHARTAGKIYSNLEFSRSVPVIFQKCTRFWEIICDSQPFVAATKTYENFNSWLARSLSLIRPTWSSLNSYSIYYSLSVTMFAGIPAASLAPLLLDFLLQSMHSIWHCEHWISWDLPCAQLHQHSE